MASIPLKQFPPEFMPRCYKCNSTTLHFNFTRHPWAWNQAEIQFSCSMCGTSGFGEDAVISRFTPQLQAWKQERADRARFEEAARLRREEEARQAAAREIEERVLREAAEAARREERERAAAVAAAEAQAAATRAVWDPAGMAQKARDRAERIEASASHDGETALERKRRLDRERKARARAAARHRMEEAVHQAVEPQEAQPEPQVEATTAPEAPVAVEAPSREDRLAERRRKDREYRARVREAARAARAKAAEPEEGRQEPEVVDPTKCALRECASPRRQDSKYCSRACSNKNAQQNARRRKEATSGARI